MKIFFPPEVEVVVVVSAAAFFFWVEFDTLVGLVALMIAAFAVVLVLVALDAAAVVDALAMVMSDE